MTERRALALLLAVLLALGCACGAAEEEDELLIVETYEYGEWTFPIALEDMDPEYVRLANKHYLLDKSYVPDDLVKVPSNPDKGGIKWAVKPKNGQQLCRVCSEALCAMNAAIRAEDADYRALYLKSAYRSYSTQKSMYNNRLEKNNGRDDGWVNKPGASDHQTGLGCDVVPSNWKDRAMNDKMMAEPECQWMAEHCAEFGFIIRYPADKNDITEINTEPWHLRYVGVPVATYIMENGLCLEEFNEQLQEAIRTYLELGGDPALVEPFIQTPTEP